MNPLLAVHKLKYVWESLSKNGFVLLAFPGIFVDLRLFYFNIDIFFKNWYSYLEEGITHCSFFRVVQNTHAFYRRKYIKKNKNKIINSNISSDLLCSHGILRLRHLFIKCCLIPSRVMNASFFIDGTLQRRDLIQLYLTFVKSCACS